MNYVEFPNLGIHIDINPSIQITDTFSIKWYGVIIGLGFLLAVVLGFLACEKYGIKRDDLLDYILISIPCAIVGCRVYYVAFQWNHYKNDFWSIFRIWEGGLAIYGGLIAVAIGVFFMAKHKKQSCIRIFDFCVPYIILAQAIGRWGNFMNQEAYGGETDLPWGMTGNVISESMGDKLVHPTFLYESIWCFLAFAVMMLVRKHFTEKGQMCAWYFALYGFERFWVEGLRTDSLTVLRGTIRVSQWLSAALFLAGIAVIIISKMKPVEIKTEKDLEDTNDEH